MDKISALFYDFDGVMTDNHVLVDQNGTESVYVNRGDGYAIARFREMGIPQVIVSTEKNPVVARRAEKLGIPVIHGVDDKGSIIKRYASEKGIDLSKSVFVGNDLNDLPAFEVCGTKAAPMDAEEEILAIADMVLKRKGGDGVIRELYRELCKREGTPVSKRIGGAKGKYKAPADFN